MTETIDERPTKVRVEPTKNIAGTAGKPKGDYMFGPMFVK
jgi:hypothetical protein